MIEHSAITSFYFGYAFMSIGMAILNLILGVVVDVASQARDRMRKEIDDEKLVEMLELHSHLLDVCKMMDLDGNGELTREELVHGYAENDKFREILQVMDITEEDLEILWTCLDTDRSGAISYTEFVTSCYRLKSSNTHFMLAYIKYYITMIKNKICQEIEDVREAIVDEEKKIEQELQNEQITREKMEEELHHIEAEEEMIEANTACLAGLERSGSNGHSGHGGFNLENTKIMQEFRELASNLSGQIKTLADGLLKSGSGGTDVASWELSKDKDYGIDLLSNPLSSETDRLKDLDSSRGDYSNLLQNTYQRQLALMASMEDIKQQLELRSASSPAQPLLTVPQERKHWSMTSGCCDRGAAVKVVQVSAGAAARPS